MKQNILNLWNHRFLLEQTFVREFRVRYKQTFVGILWALAQPSIMACLFFYIMKIFRSSYSSGAVQFICTYFCMTLWTFFSSSVQFSINSIVGHPDLITKIKFPREIFPISFVAVSFVDMTIALTLGVVLTALFSSENLGQLAWLIPAIGILIPFTLGTSILIAGLNVKYRDFKYITPIGLQILFFLTPVFYPLFSLGPLIKKIIIFNPIASGVVLFKWGSFSSETYDPMIPVVLILSLLWLAIALKIFNRLNQEMADVI